MTTHYNQDDLNLYNMLANWIMYLCSGLRSEDKKGGVDRSSTVIAKDPEGN